MSIDVQIILDTVKRYNPEFFNSKKDFQIINDVILLKEDQKEFKPSLLYICRTSDLNKLKPLDLPINILCIKDSPLSNEVRENPQINLILINENIDIINLYNEINSTVNKKNHFTQGSLKLFEAQLTGKGLQHVIDVAHEIIGNPILVNDLSQKLLAYSKNIDVNDLSWKEMITKGYGSYDVFKQLKNSGAYEQLYKSENPLVSKFDFSSFNWMAIRIQIDGKVVGQITLNDFERPFQETDSEFLKLLSKVVSTEMQKSSYLRFSKGLKYEFFLTELLDEKITQRKIIDERLKLLDLDLAENLYVFSVRLRPEANDISLLPYFRDMLGAMIPGNKSVLYNNDIVFLIGRPKNKLLQKSQLDGVLKLLGENLMVGGLSRAFHNIADLRESYLQSIKAVELGIRLKKENLLFYYEDYAIYHLLDVAAEGKDLKSFCNSALFNLIAYDQKNHTNFTHSLYIYLSSGCDLAEAAKMVNIHRNSMDYRIKKIEEILNVKINDPDVSFSLYLSLKILSFTEGSEFLKY